MTWEDKAIMVLRWIMTWLGLLATVLFAGVLFAAPASAQGANQIKCESWQFRPAQCPVPGITNARPTRVIAGDCRQGNWGFDRNGVWVINGCRAWFEVTTFGNGGGWGGGNGGGWGNGGNQGGGQVVRCESWQFRPARCAMNTRGGVQIQRVIAGDCRQGNWGYDRNGVWVINGCRADFVAGGGGGGWGGGWNGGNQNGQTIDCNSINYRPARCNVRVNNSVQIDRVHGGECIANRTWGWDRNGIWVNNGCRARFRIY